MKVAAYIFLLLVAWSCSESNDSVDQSPEPPENSNTSSAEVNWQHFTSAIFEEAKARNKLVLLDLGANWCHWCHVMEDSTYSNPEVVSYLSEHFLSCEEDQDLRGDLSALYGRYGWPATIVFDADGQELLRMRGYRNPRQFLEILKSLIANPEPLPDEAVAVSNRSSSLLDQETLEQLDRTFKDFLDMEIGGYRTDKKSIQEPGFNYALRRYKQDPFLEEWLHKTVNNSYALVDPEFGGVYQYSTGGNWNEAHYEKLLSVQARYIRMYARYGIEFNDLEAIEKAEHILEYVDEFLRNGPYYGNSQDADLKQGTKADSYYKLSRQERMKLGTPSVDTRVFLGENSDIITAHFLLWCATDRVLLRSHAREVADDLSIDFNSNVTHIQHNTREPENTLVTLEDNLSYLNMVYWMDKLGEDPYNAGAATAHQIIRSFRADHGLLESFIGGDGVSSEPRMLENIRAAQILANVGHQYQNDSLLEVANDIFKMLLTDKNLSNPYFAPLLLDIHELLNNEPYQAAFVAIKPELGHDALEQMRRRVLAFRNPYVVCADYGAYGQVPEDKEFLLQSISEHGLFFCTSSYCSRPMFTIGDLESFLATLD